MEAKDALRAGATRVSAGPERGRRYWLVGLGILALLAVVFLGAFLADRQFRPGVGIQPALTAVPEGSTQTPAGAYGSATSQPTATPTIVAVVAPSGTPSPGGMRVADSPLEMEIEAAYLKYLQVYSDAVANLDTSHLQEVLDGQALQWVTDEVNDLKAKGRPGKIIEDDRLTSIAFVTETSASVADEYTSRSVFVDPNTKQPLPRTGPPLRVRQSYDLRKINGVWKIVNGTREVLGEVRQ